MAGLDKRVVDYSAALEGLTDGMTVAVGRFWAVWNSRKSHPRDPAPGYQQPNRHFQ